MAAPSIPVLILLLLITVTVNKVNSTSPQPSIGDVHLTPFPESKNYHEVLVYYTDKIDKPSYGGICSSNHGGEGAVICRQLGYSHIASTQRFTGHSVWLKDVDCDRHDVHILRCQHVVTSGSERLSCNSSLLVQCDFSRPWYSEYYDGQVALCPSDNQTLETGSNTWSSVSFGVISLYLNDTWKGVHLKPDSPLQSYEADTVCRQMGFTGAITGTAVASTASIYTFEKCYTRSHPFTLEHGAWLASSDIHCSMGTQNCLGCCYSYPTSQCSSCGYQMIIKCTFDPFKTDSVTAGIVKSSTACEFNEEKKVSDCKTDLSTSNDIIFPNNDSQLFLCPPDDIGTIGDKNISFGLIMMNSRLDLRDNGTWRGLNQPDNHTLGSNEANTICRQLGFTNAQPGSVLTRKEVTSLTFDHCFDNRLSYQVQFGAWMTTKDLHCSSDSETCIGCCFKKDLKSLVCENCSDLNNIVIQCNSNIEGLNSINGGSPSGCELTTTSCYQAKDNQFDIIIGLSVGLGVIVVVSLFVIVFVIVFVLFRFRRRCCPRNPIYGNI